MSYDLGLDISYSYITKNNVALLKRACRYYGSWENAVVLAGIDYDLIRRYKRWTKDKIIEKIQEYYKKNEDLSWRNVSLFLDPRLAAAATHGNRFSSWNDALLMANIPPDEIARYQKWSIYKIHKELERCIKSGQPLDRNSLAKNESKLLAAIYRVGRGLVIERRIVLEKLGLLDQYSYYRINSNKSKIKLKEKMTD